MWYCLTILVVIASSQLWTDVALAAPKSNDENRRLDLDEVWMNFKKTYSKQYDDELEDAYRRSVWQENVDFIQKHNVEADLGKHSYTLGVNEYADLTVDEFSKMMLNTQVPTNYNATRSANEVDDFADDAIVPAAVDWRTRGYVTPVKNQGGCGSCWAFSSTGSLEGQWFRKTGRLVCLSEQNLVDCSTGYGNHGCSGGWMANAFKYIIANRGIDTCAAYPYEARNANCRFNRGAVGATCTGYKAVAASETALQTAVATVGPVSVAIYAGLRTFQLYRSGVYTDAACRATVNHAVLVVGYGNYAGQDYWTVKNSWGTSWGQQGYIWMRRNYGNMCNIASYGIYPTV